MSWINSRLELREVVSNATRRFSMSMDEGAVLMPAPSHGSCQEAKRLKKLAKLNLGLTWGRPAARTARTSVVDIDRRGLNGLRRGGRAVEGGGLLNRYTG